MTSAPREKLTDRAMDIVFGRRSTPEEKAFADLAVPPRSIRRLLAILIGFSFLVLLPLMVASEGWVSFVPKIDRDWFWGAFLVNLALRFAQELVEKHYERKARDAQASAA